MSKAQLRKAVVGCALGASVLGQAAPACAHAFGQRYDLPVPLGEQYPVGYGLREYVRVEVRL